MAIKKENRFFTTLENFSGVEAFFYNGRVFCVKVSNEERQAFEEGGSREEGFICYVQEANGRRLNSITFPIFRGVGQAFLGSTFNTFLDDADTSRRLKIFPYFIFYCKVSSTHFSLLIIRENIKEGMPN